MSKVFVLFFATFFLILGSCQQAVTPPPVVITEKPNVHVMNSKWYVVKEATIKARALDSIEVIAAEVDAYNAANTDDQQFLIEGEIPPIEQAPLADMWMVDPVTYAVVDEAHGISRELVREYWDEWKAGVALQGLVLFVDNIPPAPIPDPNPPTPYEKCSIYAFDADGVLQFETHCEDWAIHEARSQEDWFYILSNAWQGEIAMNRPGWTLVLGRLWTPPDPDPEPLP